jgi:hypothetical protein
VPAFSKKDFVKTIDGEEKTVINWAHTIGLLSPKECLENTESYVKFAYLAGLASFGYALDQAAGVEAGKITHNPVAVGAKS